jgi:hypothetical protein
MLLSLATRKALQARYLLSKSLPIFYEVDKCVGTHWIHGVVNAFEFYESADTVAKQLRLPVEE